jgi:membrane-bound lytic murein transglycosylase D
MNKWIFIYIVLLSLQVSYVLAEPTKPSNDDLYQLGKQLFDQYAPPEVKAEYEFPSREEADKLLGKIQKALESDSLSDLAAYEPQARLLLAFLNTIPEQADTAQWLESRLDEIQEAKAVTTIPYKTPTHIKPNSNQPSPTTDRIPYYESWLKRERNRVSSPVDDSLINELKKAFKAEGVPSELIWIAEAESSMNPTARSPSGAKGLFQLTSDTAKRLGLSTFLPDERINPTKSAHAAAHYLKILGHDLGSWPLAIAGYNAGEGRIKKLLESKHAKTYAQIADTLPAGTRMYVPKVISLIEVRTGTSLSNIPKP